MRCVNRHRHSQGKFGLRFKNIEIEHRQHKTPALSQTLPHAQTRPFTHPFTHPTRQKNIIFPWADLERGRPLRKLLQLPQAPGLLQPLVLLLLQLGLELLPALPFGFALLPEGLLSRSVLLALPLELLGEPDNLRPGLHQRLADGLGQSLAVAGTPRGLALRELPPLGLPDLEDLLELQEVLLALGADTVEEVFQAGGGSRQEHGNARVRNRWVWRDGRWMHRLKTGGARWARFVQRRLSCHPHKPT